MTITTYAFDLVYTGASANDGTGDDLRTAFDKVNYNFSNIGEVGLDVGNIQVDGSANVAGFLNVQGNVFINSTYAPSANNSPGTAGQIAWDVGNVYICVAANTWVRASLTSAF